MPFKHSNRTFRSRIELSTVNNYRWHKLKNAATSIRGRWQFYTVRRLRMPIRIHRHFSVSVVLTHSWLNCQDRCFRRTILFLLFWSPHHPHLIEWAKKDTIYQTIETFIGSIFYAFVEKSVCNASQLCVLIECLVCAVCLQSVGLFALTFVLIWAIFSYGSSRKSSKWSRIYRALGFRLIWQSVCLWCGRATGKFVLLSFKRAIRML